nr:GNAT family N-acetyltransferase [Kibdelosporangium sp. MJ126-NF4]CEL12972.1 GCN5-related N-acetyltransferase [Kibdelosporangium sp. MJ126-NF4]CTQ98657.1 GCN5-related N-acetyltransferase [Kibdelosporangium sp. MJ126-NF4]
MADSEPTRTAARPTTVSLRRARPDDAADVAALLVELGYPDNEVAAVGQRLAMWAQEPAGVVLVAQLGGRVVGTVAVAAIPYLEQEGRWGRIVALVVSAECRGQGVGRQLVEAAEAAASGLGCVKMEVSSSRARTESHPFYRSLGYRDWADRSTRYLKDTSP